MRKYFCIAGAVLFSSLGWTPATNGADPDQGFLYGTVETGSGQIYTGFLRWGKEEAFWGDFFNSAKEDLPEIDRLDRRERRNRSGIRILGRDLGYDWSNEYTSRQFVARFGDIEKIEPHSREDADVTMKSGSVYRVSGSSNDVSADITIHDKDIGEVTVPWRRIERIRFAAVPSGTQRDEIRLYGVVTSKEGDFTGYIQWDSDECLASDVLNGESDDGKLAIPMGKIRTIERASRRRCEVTLKDGRTMRMSGTNDVGESNRGIFVDDARFGRVRVQWNAFSRVEFQDPPGSGPAYSEFQPGRPLKGRVTSAGGRTYEGEIVLDLDESETWEFLDGNQDEVEYHIPFALVRSIAPNRRSSSRIVLRNGTELVLEDGQDVSDRNDGVVVRDEPKAEGTFLAWDEVEKIEFE